MRIHSSIKWIVGIAVVLAMLLAAAAAGRQDDVKDFEARVQKYLDLHKKAESKVPSIPKEVTDPAVLAKHELQLAEAIRSLRPNAMPGEVFIPGVRRMLAGIVKSQVQGPAGKDAKQTIVGEGNPKSPDSPTPVVIKVNGSYPQAAPLSTVPPSVLMALPVLPKELEYRFVGHDLILRDVNANLIVDILAKAF